MLGSGIPFGFIDIGIAALNSLPMAFPVSAAGFTFTAVGGR
jgi:hypothetical protein